MHIRRFHVQSDKEKMVRRLNDYESFHNDGHIFLDVYGGYGYQLRRMNGEGGESLEYPKGGRLTAREMFYYLEGRLNA